MTVGSATMTNFQYKGNVDLPLAGGGTVTMMEFTVDSMSMSNATTVISEDGQTGTENDASFTASGVTMYATKLSGSLLGVPRHLHAVDRERCPARRREPGHRRGAASP